MVERQTFNNQEADRETGLYDLSDRRYDPETGHFPSPDRLWETDRATSPYAYCEDNPVRLADPTGMQAAPTIPTDGKEGFVEGVGKDLYNDFSSGIFDTYICPVCPTLRLLIEPAKTVGGYVETFKNATGMNGGGAAARFWTTKAIETVVFGGAARVAAARPVAPTPAAEATPAAEPAAPAEAAAGKATQTTRAEQTPAKAPSATAAGATRGLRGRVLSPAEQSEFEAFAKRAKSAGLHENPNRTGSWGTGVGRDFKEVARIDVGEDGKPGWEGRSHMHINGEKAHLPLNAKIPGEK
ncbi:MAG: RHS repeat-associated core domain-containing protein [Bacteroidetes bacterium]|nr:RHS repeat-associated core domain-containing protein [Bacteroidota bacterium]